MEASRGARPRRRVPGGRMRVMSSDPVRSRPRRMAEYGVPATLEGLLPWSWAAERLAGSRNYWVSTADARGIPHAAPVWGVWLDGAFLFDTAPGSRKARNVVAQPRVVVTTEQASEPVMLHGLAERVRDDGAIEAHLVAYEAKYGSRPPGTRYLVRPVVAFGFIEDASQFGTSATRWEWLRA